MQIERDVTIKSWDETWTYRPAVLVTPRSVDDLVKIMTDTENFPAPVRPAGSMHSTARINGDQGGTMVDMKAMDRILTYGEDSVTVEGGVTHQVLANALKERGQQLHITTEIGNVTLAAMAIAATKDSSFPDELGQVSSYVTSMKFVTPQGEVREINERDNPDEMRIMRSSYGLCGIVFELTIRTKPTVAQSVRHVQMSLAEFRKRFPLYKQQGYAVMYYIFPYERYALVEIRKDNPGVEPKSRHRWVYRNRFWRKYGPAVALWIRRRTSNPKLIALADRIHFSILRFGLNAVVRGDNTWPHAQIINYKRDPGPNKYLFSMWAFPEPGFFDILDAYCDFCIGYAKRTGFRCNLPNVGYSIAADHGALLSYCWNGPTLSIDPASTGGPEWEAFLKDYNEFCSERGGEPLFNQTPFLTREQARKAFGDRLETFAEYRKKADPRDRLLDSYFRELLS
jgi:L-gulonolactone oxidase